MATKRKVINKSNFPRKMPVLFTWLVFLSLSHWDAPQWLWGVGGTVVGLVWLSFVYDWSKYDDEEVDIFEKD